MRDGDLLLDDLRQWVESVRELYARPEFPDLQAGDHSELDAFIDRYSDWELRELELGRVLRDAQDLGAQPEQLSPDRLLLVWQAAEILAGLHSVPGNGAVFAMRIGNHFWRRDKPADAVPFLQRWCDTIQASSTDSWQRLMSLRNLCDCLQDDHQPDRALAVAEQFLERARELQTTACEALALRARGNLRVALGRNGALEDLRAALDLRRCITAEQAGEYAVPGLDGFLDDVGNASRRAGDIEGAVAAFLELADLQERAGEPELRARAISDLGYTYNLAGDETRGVQYLHSAAAIAEQAGDIANAERWRRQARNVGISPGVAHLSLEGDELADSASGHEAATRLEALLAAGAAEEAVTLGERILAGATASRDNDLRMVVLQNTGVGHALLGNYQAAVPLFHQAIRLADGFDNAIASVGLREGLASAYVKLRKPGLAVDVLAAAVAAGDLLLSKTPGSEARQQIGVAFRRVYALLASILSQAGSHARMASVTESARSRNLLGWMQAAVALAGISGDPLHADLLDRLRAVELELEVAQATQAARTVTVERLRDIAERRRELRAAIDDILVAHHHRPLYSGQHVPSFPDVEEMLPRVVEAEDRVLFLFCVPEGVCAAVGFTRNGLVTVDGTFVPWEADARIAALSFWDASRPRSPRDLALAAMHRDYERCMSVVRERLFEPLNAVLSSSPVGNLVVIPEGELSRVPYWELFEMSSATGSFCVAPSLQVFRLCRGRPYEPGGSTLLVPDVTGGLAYATVDLAAVRAVRSGNVTECSFIEDVVANADGVSLIHVAAHGVFNPENPYLGGIVLDERGPSDGWTSQYVGPGRAFRPARESVAPWPLLTVARCVSSLKLTASPVVVLSTCESGVPRLHLGGELTGLPNAFLVAGARSVIASLSRVHDAATAVLMHHFYDVWEGGRGTTRGVARSLVESRRRLAASTRQDIEAIVGPVARLPEGDRPFADPLFTDAFQCFGAP